MGPMALAIFRAVVRENGVTRGGKLNRVQSNVTTRIKQLEEELGAALFVRDGRRLVLTPAGHTLLPYAERLLALADEARDAIRETRRAGGCGSARWRARPRAACRPCSRAITMRGPTCRWSC